MRLLDIKKGAYPTIIKPNLGNPSIINFKDYKDSGDNFVQRVTFDVFVIAVPYQDVEEILNYFHLNIFIQPLLKDEGDFSNRRGELFPLQILEIKRMENRDFREFKFLDEDNCLSWDILKSTEKIEGLFGMRTALYKIKFKLRKSRTLNTLIKESGKSFLLFDIVHVLPNKIERKVNYHSLAIFNKDWANFKFIYASDLHIASRNDYIIEFLEEKAKKRLQNPLLRHSRDLFILNRKFIFKEGFQEDKLNELRYAKYNFNYNLRLFIEYINEAVSDNKVDFVILGGDLVDYIDIAKGLESYPNNYYVLIDIFLGINRGNFKREELINKKEINAPIFTTVGNHDYRKGHYNIRIGIIRKKFGLTQQDVRGYKDLKSFTYYKALYSKKRLVEDYLRLFNPNLNHRVKIGNKYSFIFLDTGRDSVAGLHDLLKGAPSTKGLKDDQIDLLRQYIQLSGNDKVVIVMHTPPLSPNISFWKKRTLKKKFRIRRKLRWSDFYEDNLKKHLGSPRLDKFVLLKYETIMYHFSRLLKILTGSDNVIRRKVDLILCGHTHTNKQFRLKEAKKTEAKSITMGFYFTPIYIEFPCKVYTDDYQSIINNFNNVFNLQSWYDVNKPFVFQVQALGPVSDKLSVIPPGFLLNSVQEDKLVNIKNYSLHLIS